MDFSNALSEGVLFSPILSQTISQLKFRLLDPTMKEKIMSELNDNWEYENNFYSDTLESTINEIVTSNYDIQIEIANNIDAYGEFFSEEKKVLINLKDIAKDLNLFKIMKMKNRISFVDDYIIQIIKVLSHELTHYAQSKKRQFRVLRRISSEFNEEYLNDKDEMMSFAIEIAESMKSDNFTKDEALDIISLGKSEEYYHRELKDYMDMKGSLSNWKTFLIYLYRYVNDHWEEL